jgi:hypothetical protein
MPTYLVESYAANRPERIDDVREHARLAAELATNVAYLRTTFLPDDEVVLHMFEAPSAEALRVAVSSARLDHERIVEAVEPSASLSPEVRTARIVAAEEIGIGIPEPTEKGEG